MDDFVCKAFSKAVSEKMFEEHFHQNKSDGRKELIFVDTSSTFLTCQMQLPYKYPVRFQNLWPENVKIDGRYDKTIVKDWIMVLWKRNNKIYSFFFWDPVSNANMIIDVERKDKRGKCMRSKVVKYGVY